MLIIGFIIALPLMLFNIPTGDPVVVWKGGKKREKLKKPVIYSEKEESKTQKNDDFLKEFDEKEKKNDEADTVKWGLDEMSDIIIERDGQRYYSRATLQGTPYIDANIVPSFNEYESEEDKNAKANQAIEELREYVKIWSDEELRKSIYEEYVKKIRDKAKK